MSALATLALALAPLQGLPPGVDGALQARINSAIDRGVAALMRTQELDGSWRTNLEDFGTGMTALATYTLLKSGVAPDHPVIARAFAFLRGRETEKTYSMACLVLAILGRGDPEDRTWLEECVARLSDWEMAGYAYPDGATDLSNTSYAALALYAAGEAGVKVPEKTWQGIADYALSCRERGATGKGAVTGGPGADAPLGFAYQPHERNPSGSMTASGVAVLAMAERRLKPFPGEMQRARAQGLSWLTVNFTVENNPMRDRITSKWITEDAHHLYYLYALERACHLTGMERLGERAWYAEGARWLVEHQEHVGTWVNNQPNTCFALLFLSRATAGGRAAVTPAEPAAAAAPPPEFEGDLDLRVSARAPRVLWIAGYGAGVMKDFTWDAEDGGGLRVLAARFYATPPHGAERLAGTVHGNPGAAGERLRLDLPLAPDRAGTWSFAAEADLLIPGGDPADPGAVVTLRSRSVTADFFDVPDAARDRYADDGRRNLLPWDRCTVAASSQPDDAYFEARRAADGLQGTGWRCRDDDRAPWISVDLNRAVRADRLLLSQHYDFRHQDPAHAGRITRVEVRINGEKRGIVAAMDPDPERKTEIELPTKPIRTFEIRVLERTPGEGGADGVGFNEIELQRGR